MYIQNLKCLLLLLNFLVLNLLKCNAQSKTITGFAQGTSYSILYYSNENIPKIEIEKILLNLDSSLSIYKPYSLISKFNTNEEFIKLDFHLKNVIESSFKHYKKSNGIFDISIGPITELYGLGNQNIKNLPSKTTIKKKIKLIGSPNLYIRNDTLFKNNSNIKLDINGIAQGYSVDVLADFLDSLEIKNYLIELGGEIRTKGTHPDGRKFKVAIEVPAFEEGAWIVKNEVLEVYNCAITTSGGLDKKIGVSQIRSHINPKTGKPIKSRTIAATIITDLAIDADALDNYLIAMKTNNVRKFVKKYRDLDVILVQKSKRNKYRIIKIKRPY